MSGAFSVADIANMLNTLIPLDDITPWYQGSDIPPKKMGNAINYYADGVSPAEILALGDGTVFGSAKHGIIITADMLYARTMEEEFSVPLDEIECATNAGGFPNYSIELECSDGSNHLIGTGGFDKVQDHLVDFFNAIAGLNNGKNPVEEEVCEEQTEPIYEEPAVPQFTSGALDTSVRNINAGLRLISVCPHDEIDETGQLFETAMASNEEWPLLKGSCQYVGFNKRKIEGLFLFTNQRLVVFSTENRAKILFVEISMRMLDKIPVPFFDSLVGFILFSIPRMIYVACCGGKEKMIADSLILDNDLLLSDDPPLHKAQEFSYQQLAETVSQVDLGSGVWTGILSRAFGISFPPKGLGKTFKTPNDLILPEYETLEPFESLLYAINGTLRQHGLSYQLDEKNQQLSIIPDEVEGKAAA